MDDEISNNYIKFYESLSKDELRYELDKVSARLKEIAMFREIRSDIDNDFFIKSLDVLEKDSSRLTVERRLLESYYYS